MVSKPDSRDENEKQICTSISYYYYMDLVAKHVYAHVPRNVIYDIQYTGLREWSNFYSLNWFIFFLKLDCVIGPKRMREKTERWNIHCLGLNAFTINLLPSKTRFNIYSTFPCIKNPIINVRIYWDHLIHKSILPLVKGQIMMPNMR